MQYPLKLQFNIITNMLRHITKKKNMKQKSEDMIKTEARKTWSETGFSWTFKVLKPMSFQGLRPLDHR